jgi:hypothetical protein
LTYLERQKSYDPDKLRWEEAEEEKIRLKQYVSLCSKGRHNKPLLLTDKRTEAAIFCCSKFLSLTCLFMHCLDLTMHEESSQPYLVSTYYTVLKKIIEILPNQKLLWPLCTTLDHKLASK